MSIFLSSSIGIGVTFKFVSFAAKSQLECLCLLKVTKDGFYSIPMLVTHIVKKM
jgi:hypothetical protein